MQYVLVSIHCECMKNMAFLNGLGLVFCLNRYILFYHVWKYTLYLVYSTFCIKNDFCSWCKVVVPQVGYSQIDMSKSNLEFRKPVVISK